MAICVSYLTPIITYSIKRHETAVDLRQFMNEVDNFVL